jgi:L-amino acid N-acyltransferase YncA
MSSARRRELQAGGIATALLQTLIGSTEVAGIWTIQSGIFPENAASLHLHPEVGFRTVGTRQRIGRHHGRWRDVILIERRITTAGSAGQRPRRLGRGSRVPQLVTVSGTRSG